jgi:aspartyl-tRNA(Asn)/glutamyl-tRNA(Gln) amidotransferase subunit C
MLLDKAQTAKIANLARIRLSDEELARLQGDLNSILKFVEQLDEVDTGDIEPMASVSENKLRWREDKVTDGGIADKVLANAPDRLEGFFAVPKVVE